MRVSAPNKVYESTQSNIGWENIVDTIKYVYNTIKNEYSFNPFSSEPTSNLMLGDLTFTTSGMVSEIGNCNILPLNVSELDQFLPTVNNSSDLTNTIAG
jgi:hypothetical protein